MRKLISITLIVAFVLACTQKAPENVVLRGPVFGTDFSILYYVDDGTNYMDEIEGLFENVNMSLSTYIAESRLSQINRNESNEVDEHFKKVMAASKVIYRLSEGVFDPTIGNVVNAWNFGADKNKFLTDSTTIDSLMQYVGLNRVGIVGNKIQKPKETYLEFNAIAKGYGVDVIGEFLESKGIDNYLVTIGGDMRVSGINKEKNQPWLIGIDDPNFDGSQSFSKSISLKNESMATSGTYRKYKVDANGNRYAHIINTKTGYPTKTNVLSVSVIAEDCMTADAYATTFQAMGIEKVKEFLERHHQLKVYFIYLNENNEMEFLTLNGFPE
ncbi:FAD:protein FMN transferase [Winogradskyella sp. DF17]|uniref:FAD:protein FMN transferase n=1 Tax=Winogradskyella pelagia TaxID=2819984 RepID=A0ABS3SZD1_9FLAO|nr:FAD:protein FMN transferase [Winogradskyella sp. DF17]MBO3115827.1 FAD:protein FMN transferase [Winogradskyella sp. DF17]